MKKQYILFGICFTLISLNISCKVSNHSYETLYEKELAKENPDYFQELERVLYEFQDHLIEKGIIAHADHKSYRRLLRKIQQENRKEFNISYDLHGALKNISTLKNKNGISMQGRAKLQKQHHRKGFPEPFLSDQDLEVNHGKLNDALIAKRFLEYYGKKDYNRPLVRLKLFQFLSPNSEGVRYYYLGRPSKE
ncbi:hypothetical protein [Sediminicola sp. 1XM1-17]|uniref:hypothetical protein n=1 Tax=Sediminicola sp. 1XM1-17 TaxID=3127702 RepID=UPI0030773683